jgi:pimeloyl-ACP methyl ester carboxylesterase
MIRLLIAASTLAFAAPLSALAAQPAAASAHADITQMDHISIESVGHGTPVVLIPGLASPREVYRPFVAELARSHRVLLVQVNGFGGDAPGANAQGNILPGIVADVSAYLERNHLGQADVVGHSMGGLVGLMLARDHQAQVRGLLIVDSLPFIGPIFGLPNVAAARPMAEQLRTALASGAMPRGEPSADDRQTATMATSAASRLQVSRWSHQADLPTMAQALYEDMMTDVTADLPAIARVPVRVLYAARADMAEQARTVFTTGYAGAPSIRMIPVEGSLHFIMLDQPERFRRELMDFLAH